jgi:hypothetical protein
MGNFFENIFYTFDVFKGIQILYANIFSLCVVCDKESVANITYVFVSFQELLADAKKSQHDVKVSMNT